MATSVDEFPAAAPPEAAAHFRRKLQFETDCWDVHTSTASNPKAFVLLDVRSPELYGAGHVPGAVNLPHGKIVSGTLKVFPPGILFVVYCAGPHCNGADKAAARLAALGRPVKLMIGGITGWLDEGFELARSADSTPLAGARGDRR